MCENSENCERVQNDLPLSDKDPLKIVDISFIYGTDGLNGDGKFPDNFFGKFQELQVLDISDIYSLKILDETVFDGNNSLRILKASGLEFKLTPKLLSKLTKLTNIEFNDNENRVLPNKFLNGLTKLKSVKFKHTLIKIIPEDLFVDNSQLEDVDFSYNDIEYLPIKLFKGLTELEKISFVETKIQTFHDFFESSSPLLINFERSPINKMSQSAIERIEADGGQITIGCVIDSDDTDNKNEECFKKFNETESAISQGKICANKSFPENFYINFVDQELCGLPLHGTLVKEGGKQSVRGRYPWVAALYYQSKFFCGGSLSKLKCFTGIDQI